MLFPKYKQKQHALSTIFFTKEFFGYEIESKWQLLTENPVPTMIQFMSDIHTEYWHPFYIAKSMGKLPIGLRYFELQFDFWAIPNCIALSDYFQIAMVAVIPNTNMYQVAFKEGIANKFLCEGKGFLNPPLIRRENRKGNWIKENEATTLILDYFPNAEKIATITRQKCYVYVHNILSYRNFSISADLCTYKSKTLSQVEVEYKGRNGIWVPDITGYHIAYDFLQIHKILNQQYGKSLLPTIQTKFNWIIEG